MSWTPAQDEQLRAMFAAYQPTLAIALALGRVSKGKYPSAAVEQRIFQLGLHRSGAVSRCWQWAPEHLKPLAFTDEAEFVRQCYAWRDAARRATKEQAKQTKAKRIAEAVAAINVTGLSRQQAVYAKHNAGMTLQAIADEYGVTWQRIQQLIKREHIRATDPRHVTAMWEASGAALTAMREAGNA